jgi:hypothetical protein
MKSNKILFVAAALFVASYAFAADINTHPQGLQPPLKAKCCVKAGKDGKACDHHCCAEAAKKGKNCEKCGGTNPQTPSAAQHVKK